MQPNIYISNLIVVSHGKRLDGSLVGEGVAWLHIDTDVLKYRNINIEGTILKVLLK